MKPTVPPGWVRSLLRDSDSPILPQASTGRTTRQSHNVNYALLSYISDVHESDSAKETMSHPLWSEVLVAEMSSIEDNGTREDSLADTGTSEDTLVVPFISPTVISSHFQRTIALAHRPVDRGWLEHIDIS